jgi:hypothetical protein
MCPFIHPNSRKRPTQNAKDAYAEYKLNLCFTGVLGAPGGSNTLVCKALVLHMLNICSKLTCWSLALLASGGTTTWYRFSICTAYPQVNHLPADGDGGESLSGNGGGSGPRSHIVSICAGYVKRYLPFSWWSLAYLQQGAALGQHMLCICW